MSEMVVKEIIRPIMGAVLPGIKKEFDKKPGFYITRGMGMIAIVLLAITGHDKSSHNADDLIEENDDNDEFEFLEDE